jgi:hypothetical protein
MRAIDISLSVVSPDDRQMDYNVQLSIEFPVDVGRSEVRAMVEQLAAIVKDHLRESEFAPERVDIIAES